MKIDSTDFGILIQMYQWAPTMCEELGDKRQRVYRLSKAGLCRCDLPGQHPGEPRCWSLTQPGQALIDHIDGEYADSWRARGWSFEFNASAWVSKHIDYSVGAGNSRYYAIYLARKKRLGG